MASIRINPIYAAVDHEHPYLPLSGGTLTGVLTQDGGSVNIKAATLDRDGTDPQASETIWEDSRALNLMDKDGETVGRLRIGRSTGGIDYTQLLVWNEDVNGDPVYNTFAVAVSKDGTKYYSVLDAAKFRSDLGITPANIGAVAKSGDTMTGDLTMQKSRPKFNQKDTSKSFRLGQASDPAYYTGDYHVFDSNGEYLFYSESGLLPNGNVQRSFVVRRYSADGATQYNNGFYLGIDASGDPFVSFTTGAKAAWMAGLGALPLSGGTITGTLINTGGSFVYKNNSLDRDGAAPSADLWGGGFYFQDKDGANWAYLRPVHRASGRHDVQLAVFDQNGEANGFQISRSNGVNSYWMTDPAAFRTTIGCGTLATKDSASLAMTSKDGTASSTAARNANTNFTIDVALAAVSSYTPIAVVAVKLNAGPATVTLRGYDMDGLSSGGTPTVHTYWHTSAAIASGTTVTAYAQVMYLRGTAS